MTASDSLYDLTMAKMTDVGGRIRPAGMIDG